MVCAPPLDGDRWLALTDAPLDVAVAHDWAVRPDCGAVVVFTGTARDHSVGLEGVVALEYEAYPTRVVPSLAEVADAIDARWPSVARIALVHRVGTVLVGEVAVVVAVSAPHRAEAFEAARFAIDELKARAPIWKAETTAEGRSWAPAGGAR